MAVDASPVRAGTGGVGRYVADLIAHLPEHAGGRRLEVVPLTNRPDAWRTRMSGVSRLGVDGATDGRAFVAAPPRPLLVRPTVAWLQWDAARHARPPAASLFHATTGRAPIGFRRPMVVTVHDTAVLDVPDLFPYRERWLAGFWLRATVPRATAVICVSSATCDAVRRRWPATGGRVRVIRPGVRAYWLQGPSALPAALLDRLGPRWWLHVGACTDLKNVVRLVEAYGRVWQRVAEPRPALVFAGPRGEADRRVLAAAASLGVVKSVHLLGVVEDDVLRGLYAQAELTACVGLHEGFGLPALEALACGCPVVTSGRAGLADAAPCGAVVADPTDGAALEAALTAVATNAALRARLASEGHAHAVSATWAAAAAQTAAVYAAACAAET